MIDYIQYLNVPTKAGIAFIGALLAMQVVGKILEFKGKVVPEILNIRKYFARKKQERETFKAVCATLEEVKKTQAEVKKALDEVNAHYSADNIQKRNGWMKDVDSELKRDHEWIEKLDKKLDKINADTLELLVESKRETIINFAAQAIDDSNPVTREQFNRIFRIHKEYDAILKANHMTNGEVDIAMSIINEAYETHLRKRSFIEDVRGYEIGG